jgi:hypothetical protein
VVNVGNDRYIPDFHDVVRSKVKYLLSPFFEGAKVLQSGGKDK